MIQKLSWNKILWLITASLSLIAALIGVFDPSIYSKVISKSLVPGTFSQDLMTIIASMILFLLIVFTKQEDAKKQIVVLGFTLIFSLVIGELVKPLYQQTPDISALTMSLLLSLLFLVLAGFHLWNLKIKGETQIEFRVIGA